MTVRVWDLAAVLYLFLLIAGADSLADELPRPENLTLSWNPDRFTFTAQWSEPTGLDPDCKVNYTLELYLEKCPPRSAKPDYDKKRRTVYLNYTWEVSNEREICVAVMTNPMECRNKKPSKPVYKSISPPLALVRDFSCVYYSSMKMNCTWSLVSNTSDLQLFYREDHNDTLKPCISYLTDGNLKTGCHLHDIDVSTQYKFLVINGTLEASKIPNIFIIDPHNSVKPEKPKLYITKENEHLILQSSFPDFSSQCLKYKFIYKKCDENEAESTVEDHFLKLSYDAACQYIVRTQTIYTDNCGEISESEMSDPEYYGENRDPNGPFNIAMIVTPILMSCFLIVALVLFRRYKEIILPKIPEPTLLFKDMLNSNNNGGELKVQRDYFEKSLYVPITEIVEGDVRLEPESTSLHSKS